jgi:hypothetical protein
MKRFWMKKVAGFIVLAIIGVVVFSTIVMLLWNALLPSLFHFPIITFPQALGLLILSKILFGGFRGGGPKDRWKGRMKERWMNMQPEEKEKFMQVWSKRCGGRGPWGQKNPFGPEGPFSTEKDTPESSLEK